MANIIGPDVSFYQDDPQTPQGIDFAKMRTAAEYVILRAGQNLWPDRDFKANWRESKTAGFPRGSYWFYDSRADPKKQADLWVQQFGGDYGELPLFADFEDRYNGAFKGWKHIITGVNLRQTQPPSQPIWNIFINIHYGSPTTTQPNRWSQNPGQKTSGCSGNIQITVTAHFMVWKASTLI